MTLEEYITIADRVSQAMNEYMAALHGHQEMYGMSDAGRKFLDAIKRSASDVVVEAEAMRYRVLANSEK